MILDMIYHLKQIFYSVIFVMFEQYWNICPIEHLLARLEVDSQPIVRRIVELLFPSFMPLDQSPQEQILRCITLIESNPGAARVFWLNVPSHMTLTDTGWD